MGLVCLAEIDICQVGEDQLAADLPGAGEVRASHASFADACSVQVCSGDVGIDEIRPGHVGAAQICTIRPEILEGRANQECPEETRLAQAAFAHLYSPRLWPCRHPLKSTSGVAARLWVRVSDFGLQSLSGWKTTWLSMIRDTRATGNAKPLINKTFAERLPNT